MGNWHASSDNPGSISGSRLLAIFLPSLTGGGAERMMVNLARGICNRGMAVDLVLVRAEGPYLSQVPPGVRVVDLKSSRVLASLPSLVRYLRQRRPSFMLSTLEHANIIALWSKRLARVSTRIVVRQADILSVSSRNNNKLKVRLTPLFARLFYPWADGIVAVSQGVADDLSKHAGLPAGRIKVAYNPVVTPDLLDRSRETIKHPWFEPGAPPVVLGAGRLTAQKDFSTLIRAFARVRSRRPLRLIILGEGEDRPRLEALVRSLGLESDVSMPGFVENPFAFMRMSSVFVLSSVWEGLPGVLIQAMACGCPVVSTNCPSGPAEILENGKYGALVPVGDVEGMGRNISLALERPVDPDAARSRALNFSLNKITGRYLEILCDGVNG